jgi:hypothetical protein
MPYMRGSMLARGYAEALSIRGAEPEASREDASRNHPLKCHSRLKSPARYRTAMHRLRACWRIIRAAAALAGDMPEMSGGGSCSAGVGGIAR